MLTKCSHTEIHMSCVRVCTYATKSKLQVNYFLTWPWIKMGVRGIVLCVVALYGSREVENRNTVNDITRIPQLHKHPLLWTAFAYKQWVSRVLSKSLLITNTHSQVCELGKQNSYKTQMHRGWDVWCYGVKYLLRFQHYLHLRINSNTDIAFSIMCVPENPTY